jgi:uncharacterized protein (TIGR00369 family)
MEMSSVKNLIEEMIPFVKKTGILVDDLSPSKVVLRLPHDPSNLNPLGILHAGATFTLAETAAAAMCIMAFGQKVMFIGKQVEIRFRRPGKGNVKAISQLTPLDAQRALDAVQREGKTDCALLVDVVDSTGEPISSATVTMSVRRL